MQTSIMKTVVIAGAMLSSSAFAAVIAEKPVSLPESLSGKGSRDGDCTKSTVKNVKPCTKRVMFEALKGASETTQLPTTARYEARGGVLI